MEENIISVYKIFTKEKFLWAKLKSLTSPCGDASESLPPSHPRPVEKKSLQAKQSSILPCITLLFQGITANMWKSNKLEAIFEDREKQLVHIF